MADGHVPTDEIARQAEKGLELREKFGRGGTEVGVARARDLKNRRALSDTTVRRMASYFARHDVDKRGKNWGDAEKPSAGYIAWLLWGGDPGRAWAERLKKKLDDERAKSKAAGKEG